MHTYVAQYHFADGRVPGQQGSRHMSVVPYGAFQTRDGWVAIGVFTERFWAGFCRALGRPEWSEDARYATNELRVRNRGSLDPAIGDVLRAQDVEEWLSRLNAEGIPAAPVLTLDRTLELPQLGLRGMVTSYEHPVAGHVKTLGDPIRRGAPRPSPLLGQHTVEVLRELGALSDNEITSLMNSGIARGA